MPFNPKRMATGIGSFPHKDPSQACDIILKTMHEIPLWPQLPNIDFREQMEIQYSEGLPCVVLDETKGRMHFNTEEESTGELEKFYENYMSENLDHFKISPKFSRGIYEMEKRLSGMDISKVEFFKSHVTGPVTFGLTVVDQNKRLLYYNEVFRDIIVKAVTMKARWIVDKFRHFKHEQICFLDEPILSGFGSSTYVSVQRSDIVNSLSEVIDALHKDSVWVGAHCCGNTEWTILMDAGVDIISFDAYDFGDTIGYYPSQTKKFLDKGGVLAWGIVPTSEKINQETPKSLRTKLEGLIDNLSSKGIDKKKIWERCLLTPSCGTGSLPVELSEKIFEYLCVLSREVANYH